MGYDWLFVSHRMGDSEDSMSKWVEIKETFDAADTLQEAKAKQLAALALMGKNVTDMHRETGIDPKTIKKIMEGEQFRALVTKAGDIAFSVALARLRVEAKERINKAWAVIDTQLEKGNLNAAIQVFKLIDKEMEKKETKGDTVIQIAMPRPTENVTPAPKRVDIDADYTEAGNETGKD